MRPDAWVGRRTGAPLRPVWLSPITVDALPVLPGFAMVVNVTVFDSDLPLADVPVIFAVDRVIFTHEGEVLTRRPAELLPDSFVL